MPVSEDEMSSVQKADNEPPKSQNDLPRDSLVSTAAKFLTSPSVRSSSDSLKDAFLKKKGLTDEEIALAKEEASKLILSKPVGMRVPDSSQVVPYRRSRWLLFRDVVNTIACVGAVSYSFNWLLQNYIIPFLYGSSNKKSIDERLSDLDKLVESCLCDIKSSINKINVDVSKINDQKQENITRQIEEIKAEVMSLKKLLLSRKQFPSATVSGPPSIPAWQMAVEEDKDTEEEGNGSTTNGGETNGSDSSIEMIKE